MCTTPIFTPEMMFSYFTPKLQLAGDSTLGLLGSYRTKNCYIFKQGTNPLVLICLWDCETKICTFIRCSSLNKKEK